MLDDAVVTAGDLMTRDVAVVQRLNFENGGRGKIMQKDAAFDLRPNDGVVDVVG